MTAMETKYRAKGKITGEWLYGEKLTDQISGTAAIVTYVNLSGNVTDLSEFNIYAVRPETLGRFTGLTDKNGKEIFEGDIVNLFNMRGKIVFEKGAFGIAIYPYIKWDLLEDKVPYNNRSEFCYNDNFISLWELYWNFDQDDYPLYGVEVIGNIHDNPELLEGDNDDESN